MDTNLNKPQIIPLVSIVIPIFKPKQEYLIALVNSINQQTYENIEIIVSDDEISTENIVYFKKLEKFNFKYVVNLSGENGIFGNLNNAIKNSNGAYTQIFCQDDIMLPDFIQEQINAFGSDPSIGMVFSKFNPIDGKGNIAPSHRKGFTKLKADRITPDRAINYFFVFGCIPGNLSPVMLRKEVFEKVGYFNQEYPYGGDFEFWVRVGLHYGIIYNKKVILNIRFHPENASSTLGLVAHQKDIKRIFMFLEEKNTVRCSTFKKKIYIHQTLLRKYLGAYIRGIHQDLSIFDFFDKKPYTLFWAIMSSLITCYGYFTINIGEKNL